MKTININTNGVSDGETINININDDGVQVTPTLQDILTNGNDGGGLEVANIADPLSDQSAATKKYVDDNIPAAFSGDYNDLSNKPTLFDGDYNSLTNKPAIGLPYLVYTALLSQSGTDPIAASTIHENTLGSISYSGDQTQLNILTDINFDATKVFIGGMSSNYNGNAGGGFPIFSGQTLAGYCVINWQQGAGSKLLIKVCFADVSGTLISLSSLVNADVFALPEIKVYP